MSRRRSARMAKFLKEEVSRIIQRQIKDPRIGFVTVTDVKITDDLRYATVFITVYGSPSDRERTLAGMENAKGFIRGQIGSRIRSRYTPEIIFKLDESLERVAHISEVLDGIKKEQKR